MIGLVLGAAGLGMQAWGMISGASAAKKAAAAEARWAAENAFVARQQAKEEERRARIEGAKALGSMRAGYASSGVTIEGSALDVLEESAANIELDALTIRYSGELRARGFQQEGEIARMRGKQGAAAAYLGGAAGILTGASNLLRTG